MAIPAPDRVEYQVGRADQLLVLICERQAGRTSWTLRKPGAGQRVETIWGLTSETLRRIGEIAAAIDGMAYRHGNRIEFQVGQTIHKQTVVLIGERQDGQLTWTLRKDALTQRDETDYIHGLPVEALGRITAIAAERS
jgi:hypothetical protein